jgi:hypothetical protein
MNFPSFEKSLPNPFEFGGLPSVVSSIPYF